MGTGEVLPRPPLHCTSRTYFNIATGCLTTHKSKIGLVTDVLSYNFTLGLVTMLENENELQEGLLFEAQS